MENSLKKESLKLEDYLRNIILGAQRKRPKGHYQREYRSVGVLSGGSF